MYILNKTEVAGKKKKKKKNVVCQKWDSNPRLQRRLRPERSALDRSAILTSLFLWRSFVLSFSLPAQTRRKAEQLFPKHDPPSLPCEPAPPPSSPLCFSAGSRCGGRVVHRPALYEKRLAPCPGSHSKPSLFSRVFFFFCVLFVFFFSSFFFFFFFCLWKKINKREAARSAEWNGMLRGHEAHGKGGGGGDILFGFPESFPRFLFLFFFSTLFKHYNSSRSDCRLTLPKKRPLQDFSIQQEKKNKTSETMQFWPPPLSLSLSLSLSSPLW